MSETRNRISRGSRRGDCRGREPIISKSMDQIVSLRAYRVCCTPPPPPKADDDQYLFRTHAKIEYRARAYNLPRRLGDSVDTIK